MLSPIATKTIQQLKKATLSLEDRVALTACLLDKMQVLPISQVITVTSEGGVLIKGKKLDIEQVIAIQESFVSLNDNLAFKLLLDEMRWLAIDHGVFQGLNTDMIMFSKACLFNIKQMKEIVDKFA